MKTVFKTDEIYHLWANRTHNHKIRNPAGNLWADGACLYSYQECIGILDKSTGAILSSYRWSVTTSKHQSMAARAVSGKRIYLPCKFPYDGSLNRLAENARNAGELILKGIDYQNKARIVNSAMTAKLADYYSLLDFADTVDGKGLAVRPEPLTLRNVHALREGLLTRDKQSACRQLAARYAKGLQDIKIALQPNAQGWGIDWQQNSNWLADIPENVEIIKAKFSDCGEPLPRGFLSFEKHAKELLPQVQEKLKIHNEKLALANAEKAALWRTGEYVNLPHGLPPMLRLNGDNVVTSWGASVPVTVCPILWAMVQDAIASKTESDHSIEVGNYILEKVFADGSIKVGCHTIAYSEIELIARELKYI